MEYECFSSFFFFFFLFFLFLLLSFFLFLLLPLLSYSFVFFLSFIIFSYSNLQIDPNLTEEEQQQLSKETLEAIAKLKEERAQLLEHIKELSILRQELINKLRALAEKCDPLLYTYQVLVWGGGGLCV